MSQNLQDLRLLVTEAVKSITQGKLQTVRVELGYRLYICRVNNSVQELNICSEHYNLYNVKYVQWVRNCVCPFAA